MLTIDNADILCYTMAKGEIVVDKLLTTSEVADILRIKQGTVIDKCAKGELPAHKVGRRWLISEKVLENWILCKPTG